MDYLQVLSHVVGEKMKIKIKKYHVDRTLEPSTQAENSHESHGGVTVLGGLRKLAWGQRPHRADPGLQTGQAGENLRWLGLCGLYGAVCIVPFFGLSVKQGVNARERTRSGVWLAAA